MTLSEAAEAEAAPEEEEEEEEEEEVEEVEAVRSRSRNNKRLMRATIVRVLPVPGGPTHHHHTTAYQWTAFNAALQPQKERKACTLHEHKTTGRFQTLLNRFVL